MTLCSTMLCRPFPDLCYVGPLVILAMLCRPSGDLSRVWLCYVGPLVILAVFGYVM